MKNKKANNKKTLNHKRPTINPDRHKPNIRLPRQEPPQPVLRFTALVWAKLLYWCHRGETEIGCFGISRTDDLLLIEDLHMPLQQTTPVTVGFSDESVADFFEAQFAANRRPEQFGRIWIHTHPGHCPNPSTVDEETFTRVFGGCDWAVMFILARGGATYARLRFNTGPGGSIEIPAEVDFCQAFAGSDHQAWQAEYDRCVHVLNNQPLPPNDWDLDDAIDPFTAIEASGLYDEIDPDHDDMGNET